ncbi:MAG: hypothetical protein ACTSR8_19875 [Promethearchaeota archaeon]
MRCRVCGAEIDEYQLQNFDGLCPICVRSLRGGRTQGIGKVLNLAERIDSRNQLAGTFFCIGLASLGACFFFSFSMIFMNSSPIDPLSTSNYPINLAFNGILMLFLMIGLFLITFSILYNKKTKELKAELSKE